MKRRLILIVLMLLILVPPALAAPGGTIIDSYSETNRDANVSVYGKHPSAGAAVSAAGQSFQVSGIVIIDTASFYLRKLGSPTGTMKAYLYAHSGNYGATGVPTGAALAVSDALDVETLTTTYTLINFTLTSPYTATTGNYVIALQKENDGVVDAANSVYLGDDSSAPTHSGNMVYYNNGAWSHVAARDIIFYIYANAPNIYHFTGPYYENGTAAAALDVTAVMSSRSQTFNLAAPHTRYYVDRPSLYTWPVGTTIRRYYVYSATENIRVTVPQAPYSIYGFRIRDYSGRVGNSDTYLEAIRNIGGVDIVIERALIWNTETQIPMVLEQNQIYFLRLRLSSGAYYNFGYFTPTGDAPPSLIVKGVDFDEQYQPVSQYVHIEATRVNATHIRATYTNTLNTYPTLNVTLAVTLRNGTLVYSDHTVAETAVFNWYAADNQTAYRVTVTALHSYYGTVSYTVILDPPWTPLPPLDFGAIGLPTNLVCVFIVLIFLGGVSRFSAALGVFTATVVGIGLHTMGWWVMPLQVQAAGLIIAVFMKVSGRG